MIRVALSRYKTNFIIINIINFVCFVYDVCNAIAWRVNKKISIKKSYYLIIQNSCTIRGKLKIDQIHKFVQWDSLKANFITF